MKKLVKFLLILILLPIVLIVLFSTGFFMGKTYEIREYEKEIDLTFEAAAQQYKNYQNDSSKFDQYGNEISRTTAGTKRDTNKRVLPKNSRTESHSQQTKKNPDISQTRKRN